MAKAGSVFVQSSVGSGCSSVCINNECKSTCGDNVVQTFDSSDDSEIITKEFNHIDFDSVVNKVGDVEIRRSENYRVSITASEKTIEALDVNKQGTLLAIMQKANTNLLGEIKVVITMPILKAFEHSGTGDINLSGFAQNEMRITQNGTADLIAVNNNIKTLKIDANGSVTSDWRKSIANQVLVNAQGTSDVFLNFEGEKAILSGKLAGVSSVEYCGSAEENIETKGVASVERVKC